MNSPIEMAPAPPPDQALQNRFNHHEQMSVLGATSIKAHKIAGPELCKSTRRKQQVKTACCRSWRHLPTNYQGLISWST